MPQISQRRAAAETEGKKETIRTEHEIARKIRALKGIARSKMWIKMITFDMRSCEMDYGCMVNT